jgi:hypothetical protein
MIPPPPLPKVPWLNPKTGKTEAITILEFKKKWQYKKRNASKRRKRK